MSATKLSDLLPIPGSVNKPNAYQVFGLRSGEPDTATIGAAIQRVYADLRSAKPSADPIVWKQAAQLAEAARKVLEDPTRRRQLESRFAAAESPVQPARQTPTAAQPSLDPPSAASDDDDPLAGLLPATNPLAAQTNTPATDPSSPPNTTTSAAASPAAVLGVPPLGTPPLTPAPGNTTTGNTTTGSAATTPQPAAPAPAGIGWQPPKPKKKKRRKNQSGMLVLGLFVIAMLGLIGWLLNFLVNGNRVAITPNQTGVTVAPPSAVNDRPRPAATPRDGILGGVASSGIAESLRPSNPSDASDKSMNDAMQPAEPTNSAQPPTMTPDPASPMQPDPPAMNPTPDAAPATPPTPPPPSAEMMQANQAKIAAVEQLIQSADWGQMKTAADALLKLDLPADQAKRAATLYDIADLASFYRGAIERGLATLSTGNTFEYTKDLPVIVVEAKPDELSIQYNRTTKTFTLDDMPPRLTEKIASFSLPPDQPDAIAGLALYRLIHPGTNDEYRQAALGLLASVDGKLETVDTAALQQVAKEMFSK
ncbi:hypothetical protein NHH03_08810 [Stieleria sp. TO1_6]|uniref:hypothetical protein n=1 Tax=Stieleria tagensis TaxID=2956795 RepID=UPI00209AF19C|nr:hypothetical protein [Stieleria tagensis]MCO8121834.1 hypothetical protein [Stieleria tagensis]